MDKVNKDFLSQIRDHKVFVYESGVDQLLEHFAEVEPSERKAVLAVIEWAEKEAERLSNESPTNS